ncbi:pogo transposable element derived with ZNF domain a, partial [Megalops cyprinoides]|uniref:pogo transposable element derived with ZNF domain a n=1 Tax=Megalops cyprinoides TaxID=118141 RepID=UPI0018654451
VPQVVSQQPAGQAATTATAASCPPCSSTFTTVQIPATLTIQGSAPLAQLAVKAPAAVATASAAPTPSTTQANIEKQSLKPEAQRLVKAISAVSSTVSAQPKTVEVVKGNSTAPTNGLSVPSSSFIKVGPPPANKMCPRCGAQFRVVKSLRGHMCFCCPELGQSLQAMDTAGTADTRPTPATPSPAPHKMAAPKMSNPKMVIPKMAAPNQITPKLVMNTNKPPTVVVATPLSPLPSPSQPAEGASSSEGDTHGKLIMLVDDFYYGQDKGTGGLNPWDGGQQGPMQFRCLSCNKKLKSNIRSEEPPCYCHVCGFCSSFYSDVFEHFRTSHKDTASLLCPYCLKVFRSSSSYQQHYTRHQKKSVYHCDKCRLQFLFIRDKLEHKLHHHKTHRKPRQLEGLKPGTKVTIRAYAVQNKPVGILHTNHPGVVVAKASPLLKTGEIPATPTPDRSGDKKHPPAKRKPICSMQELLTKFQEERVPLGKQSCLECNFEIPDFPNHYPTYVTCSLCHYSTCCSRAYANHMINNHVSRKTSTKYLALYKAGPRWSQLTCTTCGFTTQMGDQMAKHLVQNPSHSSSHCTLKGPPTTRLVQKSQSHTPKRGIVNNGSHSYSKAKAQKSPKTVIPVQNYPPVTTQILPLPVPVSAQSYAPELENVVAPVAPKRVGPAGGDRAGPAGGDRAGPGKDALTVWQLRIVLFALCCGVPQAARHFSTEPQLIRAWIQDKERGVQRAGRAKGGAEGEAAEQLVEWVLAQREQQLPVNEKSLFAQALELHRQRGSSSLSYEWAVDFLLRRQLGLHVTATAGRPLHSEVERKARFFTEFVQKRLQAHSTPLAAVGAMDELSVFADPDLLPDREAFQLVGVGPPLCDVVLSALADGTLLPALVFFKGHLPGTVASGLPDSVLLEARPEGFTEAERLKLWVSRVWRKGVAARGGAKAMLVLDSFRGHTLDAFLDGLKDTNTTPAVVPMGCLGRLHPLEMCVGPVVRSFLEARWSQLVDEGGAVGATPRDLVQRVLAWLAEATAHLRGQQEALRRSFRAASTIRPEEGDENPAKTQKELVRALGEVLMGTKSVSPAARKWEAVVKTMEEDDGKQEAADKENLLDMSAESVATSPRSVSLSSNPQALRQVFEKDSDVESFYGFEDSEIRKVLDP